jgi:hypothetical protein
VIRWLGAAAAIAFIAALAVFSTTSATIECEVCMRFNGREACNTSTAPERDIAVAQARNSACQQISGGVTDGIKCSQGPPARLTCSD